MLEGEVESEEGMMEVGMCGKGMDGGGEMVRGEYGKGGVSW